MDDGTVTGRVLLILATVGRRGPISLARLTQVTGVPKPTVRRIANDLAARGMLVRTAEGYDAGTDLRRLALRVTRDDALRRTAGPQLRELNRRTGQSAWLSLIDGDDVLMFDAAHGPRPVPSVDFPWPTSEKLQGYIGTATGRVVLAHRPDIAERYDRLPLRPATPHAPSSRRQLDAELRRIRDSGVAMEEEQFRLGWSCVAAPVRDAAGTVVAVVGLTGPTAAYTPSRHADTIAHAAERLSAA
ncbi:IclR family transcriptional regulator [Dactylosporangium sucinum]|uniref:IclR family transcriptional regulator n=1 Tax=Dactylosporangium sucinum TaxID=1424081 RepID=UPI00167D29AD|nr:IclR family transcriptional regulator C-terminal domain-containing protein [Dactylosporangium sucinum]